MFKQDALSQLEYYLDQVEAIQKEIVAKDEQVLKAINIGVTDRNYEQTAKLLKEVEHLLKQSTMNIQHKIELFTQNISRLSSHVQRQKLMQRCIEASGQTEKQMKSVLKNLQTLSEKTFEQRKKTMLEERQNSSISQTSNGSSDFFKSDIEGQSDSVEIKENMEIIDYEQEMIKQRQEEINKIEQLVINLNTTMKQMLDMIQEQGKQLNIIEENLNVVNDQVKGMNMISIGSSEINDQLSEKLIKNGASESNNSYSEVPDQRFVRKRNTKKCVYIILVVLLLIGGGLALYFLLK